MNLIEKVSGWLDLSPEGQRRKVEIEQRARRAELIERIERLHTKEVLVVFPLQRVIETAKAREQDAKRALLEAQAQVNQAYEVHRLAYLSVSAERDRCEAQLCALADQKIDVFIREIQAEFNARRHDISQTSSLPPKKDKFSDELLVRISTNIRFVERWSKRIHEVISRAQDLKLKNVADLDQELAALRDSIPNASAADLEYMEYAIPARDTWRQKPS